jgi:hypothetical protein
MKMSFDEWKKRVDLEVQAKCGMTADDLDDWHYSDDWRDGLSPKRCAARAIKNAKEACGL